MNPRKKILVIFGLLLVFFFTVAAKLFETQVLDHREWLQKANQVQIREVIQSQPRGRIYDRNGQLLAFDVQATSIALDNYHMTKPELLEGLLRKHLGLSQGDARKLIYREGFFTWIERKVDPDVADALQKDAQELGAWGLIFIPEWKRVYPQGSLASNVIGFSGTDDHGLEGIELQFDEALRGKEEHDEIVRGGGGTQLSTRIVDPGVPGSDIYLTLDSTIQHIAENAIQNAVRQRGAKGGFIIVLDPQSGDIIALASHKTYDLNHFETSTASQRNDWLVALTFEPGSTFKPFTVLAALDAGIIKPDDIFNGDQPMTLFGHKFHNAEYKSYGYDTVANLFKNSVNTAIIRMTQTLQPDYLYQFLQRFGFGKPTGVELPGEVSGTLHPPDTWQGTDMAAICIGQYVSVTGIQLAAAYGALANGGWLRTPHIIRPVMDFNSKTITPKGLTGSKTAPVASDQSLNELKSMMGLVVEDGTGVHAKIEGFDVAAKTGTGQKANARGGGYSDERYTSLFAGFFPLENPKYVVIVVLDEVDISKGQPYYGGIVAAPVFKEVALGIIGHEHLLPVEPAK
jgi:cell division protein FtsI/penicillin-binding protein 2